MELSINKNDIQAFRPTAKLDDARIEPFIREAQQIGLGNIFGMALYLDVYKTNTELQINKDLVNGKEYLDGQYTIEYPGIKPYLCYETLIRFVKNNPFNIVRFGIVKKSVDESESISSAELKMLVDDLKNTAGYYSAMIVKYLEDNKATYPLYKYGPSRPRTFSLNISKL